MAWCETDAAVDQCPGAVTQDGSNIRKNTLSEFYMLPFAQNSGGFVCHKVGTTNQAITPKRPIILPRDAVVELAPHV